MKLEKIIKGITVNEIIGDMAQEISGINMDSRLIEPGHIFIAVKGTQTDGHTDSGKCIRCFEEPDFQHYVFRDGRCGERCTIGCGICLFNEDGNERSEPDLCRYPR